MISTYKCNQYLWRIGCPDAGRWGHGARPRAHHIVGGRPASGGRCACVLWPPKKRNKQQQKKQTTTG